MSGTYKRHSAAIRHTVTATNIIGIRKALNASERASRGYSTSITAPQWSESEIDAIIRDTARYAPVVSGKLHDSGIATLQKAVKRYKGRFGTLQQAIIADIWHFRLVDWYCENSHWFPVYRVTARNGLFFDYINVPWQSGGNGPEIVPSCAMARVKPLWDCTIAYRQASGRRAYFSHMLAGSSLHDMEQELRGLLAHRRRDATPIDGTFSANFVSMQIGTN